MPSPARPSLAHRLADRLLYDVARPLAASMSPRAFDRLARALAVPAALPMLAVSPAQTTAYLRQVGHPDGLGRLRFAYRKALARLRGEWVYLRPDTPVRRGPGLRAFEARGEPAVVVGWSGYHMIGAAALAAERDDRVIRFPYGSEGGPGPDAVAEPWQRWEAHQAAVRHRLIGPLQLLPGRSPLAYLRALREGRSLIVMQDVPVPGADIRTLLGVERPLPVGAVRLAAAGRVGLYTISVTFRDGELWADLDGPHTGDEQALLDQLAGHIRAEPWAWTLWREFLLDPVPEPAPVASASPGPAFRLTDPAPTG
ncbi:hypothetical protein [Rubrivirga sp.]|uniref:hypothetical protein n=1 Tax=Rubrivirga sp. TaxID=1885344 RepID=UPI003B52D3C4